MCEINTNTGLTVLIKEFKLSSIYAHCSTIHLRGWMGNEDCKTMVSYQAGSHLVGIAHAVKEGVETDPSRWVLQADLVNAYNQVDRGTGLEKVKQHFPESLA